MKKILKKPLQKKIELFECFFKVNLQSQQKSAVNFPHPAKQNLHSDDPNHSEKLITEKEQVKLIQEVKSFLGYEK